MNEARLASLTAAFLYVGAAAIALVNSLAPHRLGATGVDVAVLRVCSLLCVLSASGVLLLQRALCRFWPRIAVASWGLLLLVWCGVYANYAATAQAAIVFPVFLLMILVWLGLTSPRGVSAAFVPVSIGAAAYLTHVVPTSRVSVANTTVVALVSAIVGETIAWAMQELRRREERLAVLAWSDPLTGLANRAALRSRLDEVCGTGERIVLAFVDLNGFKDVNDSFGHQVGDAVLAELAPRLRRVDGDADIVARLGGDEFVILLRDPHGELDEPALVERIRRIVAEPCSTIAPAVLSASVGIVEDPAGTRTPDDLLREADAAMYARKHGTTAGTTSEMTSRSLNRYRLAMDGLAGSFSVLRAVWHENRICDWQIVEANALVRAHYGSVCDEPVGSCLSELDRHADNSEFRAVYERALATRRREELETDLRLPGGLTVYRRLVVVPVDDDAVAVMTFDISAQKAAEAALRESEARSRAIVAAAADAILTVDDDGIILSFNRAAEAMFGVAAAEAIGNSYRPLVPDETRPALHRAVERPGQPAEVVLTRASGEAFYAQVGISRISAGEGGLYTVIVRDVTAQHHTEAALRTALELDDLTGLPNQRSLVERTEAALAAARESAAVVGLAFIDLDRFALVNDSLGHDAGDRLLVLVAERLARSGRAGDTIARIGGDHFAILRPRIEPDDDPTALADGVTEALRAPFRLDALHEVFVTASIGVTSSRGRESARDLLRYAHTAIHRARLQPTPSVGVFDRTMSETIASRLDLETALRRALERDEIRAYYQPIVRLDRGVIVGFEALARWHRPGHGIVPPDQFIPLAEETGLITELGACMLRRAIADCAAWQRDAPGVGVAVNVSSRQLLDGDFAGLVTELLRADGLAPELLTVEITESVMLEMIDATTETMRRIRDAGTHLALDDFGTGYSSLASLRRFPIDTLKIDRAFLHAIESDADLPVIHAMIDLAAAYDLQVVAEGIESETTRALLRAAGCTLGQGFLFARPLPLDHALMLLALESAVNRPGDRPAPARG